MKHLVIIPTYNEKENVAAIIDAVLSFTDMYVLIVDDGSPDGTADIVKSKQAEYGDRLHLKERAGKQGLGTAYILGFKFGIAHKYDLISEMDADFSHNPDDLMRLRQACIEGADVSIGSRYTEGGGFENWPKNRIIISKGGSFYVQMLTSMPIMDPTAGFICYKREVLESINLDKVEFTGYGFQIEMKYIAWKLGFTLKEVPIVFKDRLLGHSKMHIGIIKEAIMGVLKLRLRNVEKFYARS